MPRTVHSNGVKSEIKALAVMQLNKPVTPQEINDHVKTGDYAAKYVSMLTNTYGFRFTTQKDGRRVVSYTLVAEPDNAESLRAQKPAEPKAAKVKVPKVAKVKTVKTPTVEEVAAVKEKVKGVAAAIQAFRKDNPVVETTKTVASKRKSTVKRSAKVVNADDPMEVFGSDGSVGNVTVDGDWDSVDGLDLRKIV